MPRNDRAYVQRHIEQIINNCERSIYAIDSAKRYYEEWNWKYKGRYDVQLEFFAMMREVMLEQIKMLRQFRDAGL